MREATDGELVLRIGEGGSSASDAEAELCRRLAPRARLYGLRHLRDEALAWDLAQAAVLVVIEAARARRVEQVEHVDRFLLGTCRHLAARFREASARAAPTEPGVLDRIALAPPEAEHVDATALYRCLRTLTDRARSVLAMTYQDERSADEIGAALVRIGENRFEPGVRQEVAFPPDLDLLVHRLGGMDLRAAARVAVTVESERSGARISEAPDVPFDRERGEIFVACQQHFRDLPHDIVFRVRARQASGEEREAVYHVPHLFG
jgi:RNA polymerase sigma-70 factor (ECF subfamily)